MNREPGYNNGIYSEEEEIEILKALVQAMREGEVKYLTYGAKTKRVNAKTFECVMRSPDGMGFSAESTLGVHDLGFLFVDTVRTALGLPRPKMHDL